MNAEWFNVFGERVDLDRIDREYALNILSRVLERNLAVDPRTDPLVQKLRGRILQGRDPNWRDWLRRKRYNVRCRIAALTRNDGIDYRKLVG